MMKKLFGIKKLTVILLTTLLCLTCLPTALLAETADITIEAKDGNVSLYSLYGELKKVHNLGTLDSAEFKVVDSNNETVIEKLTVASALEYKTFENGTYKVTGAQIVKGWVQTGYFPWQGYETEEKVPLDEKTLYVRVYHEVEVNSFYVVDGLDTQHELKGVGVSSIEGPTINGETYKEGTSLLDGTKINLFEASDYIITPKAIPGYEFLELNGTKLAAGENSYTLSGKDLYEYAKVDNKGLELLFKILPSKLKNGGIKDLNDENSLVEGNIIIKASAEDKGTVLKDTMIVAKGKELNIEVATNNPFYKLDRIEVVDEDDETNNPDVTEGAFTPGTPNNDLIITAYVKESPKKKTLTVVSDIATFEVNSNEGGRLLPVDNSTYFVEEGYSYTISAKGNANGNQGNTVTAFEDGNGNSLTSEDQNDPVCEYTFTVTDNAEVTIKTTPISINIEEDLDFDYWTHKANLLTKVAEEMKFSISGVNDVKFDDVAEFQGLFSRVGIKQLPTFAENTIENAMIVTNKYETKIFVTYKAADGVEITDEEKIIFNDYRKAPIVKDEFTIDFNKIDEDGLVAAIKAEVMPNDIKDPSAYRLSMSEEDIVKAFRENPTKALTLKVYYTETKDTKYKGIAGTDIKVNAENIYYNVPVIVTPDDAAIIQAGGVKIKGSESQDDIYQNGETIKVYYGESIELEALLVSYLRPYINGVYNTYKLENVNSKTTVSVAYTNESVVTITDDGNSTIDFVGTDAGKNTVIKKANEEVEIIITPNDGYYVDVNIHETINGTVPTITYKAYENDSLRVKFIVDGKAPYYAEATAVKSELVLVDDAQLAWNKYKQNEYETNGTLAQTIFGLMYDTTNSDPNTLIFDENVTVEWLAFELPKELTENTAVNFIINTLGIKDKYYVDLSGSISDINDRFATIETTINNLVTALEKINVDASGLKAMIHQFGSADTETIRISWNGEGQNELQLKYPSLSAEGTIAIYDDRKETVTTANGFELIYGQVPKADELLTLANVIVSHGGNMLDITGNDVQFSIDFYGLEAGTYEVTAKFLGNEEYQDSVSQPFEVVVKKAPVNVVVENVKAYYGEPYDLDIAIATQYGYGEDIDHVIMIVGVEGDATGYLSIYLPQSFKDSFDHDITIGGITFNAYDEFIETLADSITNKDLVDGLNNLIKTAEDYGINMAGLNRLIDLLNLNEDHVVVEIEYDSKPTKAGIYLVAAATTDSNYETALDAGYLTIAPKEGELRFNQIDDDNTFKYLEAQSFDFGAKFYLDDQEYDSENLNTLFVGVTYDENGNEVGTYSSSEAPTEAGLYTQTVTAFGGNYHADAISRTFLILSPSLSGEPSEIKVEITPSNIVLPSTDYVVNATLWSNGEQVDGDITVRYIGLSGEGDIIYNSTEKPKALGVYQVIATYSGEPNKFLPSMNASETLTIYKKLTYIDVEDYPKNIKYDAQAHGVVGKVYDQNNEYVCDADVFYTGYDFNDNIIYESENAPTEPGYYVAEITYPGDADHFLSSARATFTIAEEATVIISPYELMVKYDGLAHEPEVLVYDWEFNEIVNPVVTKKYVKVENGIETEIQGAPILPGNYKLYASYQADHSVATDESFITIYQFETEISVKDDVREFTYNGEAQAPIFEIYDDEGNFVTDSTKNDPLLSVTYISVTDGGVVVDEMVDAGFYAAYVSYKGNEIYGISDLVALVSIKQSEANISIEIGDITTYCGETIDEITIIQKRLLNLGRSNNALSMTYTGLAERDIKDIAQVEFVAHTDEDLGENEHELTLTISEELYRRLERNYKNDLDVKAGTHKVVHNHEEKVVKPTCEEDGYTSHDCVCGDHYESNTVPALGHEFGDWYVSKKPTTSEKGRETRECELCGEKEHRDLKKLPTPTNDYIVVDTATK